MSRKGMLKVSLRVENPAALGQAFQEVAELGESHVVALRKMLSPRVSERA